MPLPGVWGPIAWKLLHAIGARAGRPIKKMEKDEKREALWLLVNLETILPCEECRKHCKEYKKQYGLPEDSSQIGAWIWAFHEAVNERLGKGEGPPFTPELGRIDSPAAIWKEYLKVIRESFQVGHLRPELVKEWSRHLYLFLATV